MKALSGDVYLFNAPAHRFNASIIVTIWVALIQRILKIGLIKCLDARSIVCLRADIGRAEYGLPVAGVMHGPFYQYYRRVSFKIWEDARISANYTAPVQSADPGVLPLRQF